MNTRRLVLVTSLFVAGCGGGGSTGSPPAPAPVPSVTTAPIGSPTSSASPAPIASTTVPAAEATVYSAEAADIGAYTAAVDAQCPGNPTAATRFDVELLGANANHLYSVLPGTTVAQAQAMATEQVGFATSVRALLPGVGFMINPLYPVLVQNQANAPTWWDTAANYPVFAAYYSTLARGLATNGIPYDVEANVIFPSYSGQSYANVGLAQLEAGVAEDASNVLTLMSPQFENIASEPLTLSQNTGQTVLDTPSGYASFTNAVRSSMTVPANATTKIGAGSADWSSETFLTAVEAVPNLAYVDEHLYPPDVLTTPGGGIAQVDAIDPAVTGKPGIITENWDEKDAGDAGNYGAANAPLLEQQNTYSFWAPLDAQYVTTTMKLARCENLSVVSFWYISELFAYLPYATASPMTPTQAQNAEAAAAVAAVDAGTLSPSGAALYEGLMGVAPAAKLRARTARP